MKILRQRSVAEDLGFFVLGILREGEGVVSGSATEENKSGIADVLAEFGIGGGWGGRSGKWASKDLGSGDGGRGS